MTRSMPHSSTLLLILWLALPGLVAAEAPWSRFRGVNGDGISDADTIPVSWKESDFRWKTKLPGAGHSSPVIWKERLFVTCSDTKTGTRTLVCLDLLDGELLWHRDFAAKTHSQHQYNNYASCSPAVDADHVYVLSATPEQVMLLAVDHGGDEVWRRDLGPFKSMHGIGTSPIVVGELVVMSNDQAGKASLIALDRRTGKTRWQIDRNSGLTPASRRPRAALRPSWAAPPSACCPRRGRTWPSIRCCPTWPIRRLSVRLRQWPWFGTHWTLVRGSFPRTGST